MRLSVLLATALLIVFAGSATAEIYRYTDSKGELHYVDDIAKVPKKYRKQLDNTKPLPDISVMDATPAPKRDARQDAPPPRQQEKKSFGSKAVEVYMTSWCGYCKKMVRFLNEKGIAYTAYDIEKDSAAARVYKELGGRGVPVVRVGTHVIHGYNPDQVMSSLGGK